MDMSDVIKYPLSAAIELCEQLDNDETNYRLNIRQRTPETDDFELNLGDYSNPWKAIEFARKLERERDEAKAALMKIEDLFIDGTDIYADRENMGLIARSALEETK